MGRPRPKLKNAYDYGLAVTAALLIPALIVFLLRQTVLSIVAWWGCWVEYYFFLFMSKRVEAKRNQTFNSDDIFRKWWRD